METRPFAVVTGASSGIGFELARQFAAHEFDLLVTGHDIGIAAAAEELQGLGATVEHVRLDLSRPDHVEELADRVLATGRPVDALALTAGRGLSGRFVEHDLAQELEIVDVAVRSTVHLARLLVPRMVARRAGRVLITSPAAAPPDTPHALGDAARSFTQSFALALHAELEETGVTVTSLTPEDDPADVAALAYEALMHGDERVVAASLTTKLQEKGGRFLPDKMKAAMHARMAEPGGAAKDD